jgi:hypothetical protein
LRHRHTEAAEWRGLADDATAVLRLSPDEAAQLNRELDELLARWMHTVRDPEPGDGRRSVLLGLRAFPLSPDGR